METKEKKTKRKVLMVVHKIIMHTMETQFHESNGSLIMCCYCPSSTDTCTRHMLFDYEFHLVGTVYKKKTSKLDRERQYAHLRLQKTYKLNQDMIIMTHLDKY